MEKMSLTVGPTELLEIVATTAKPANARKKAIKTTPPSTIAWAVATKDARHTTTTPLEIEGALQELEIANMK